MLLLRACLSLRGGSRWLALLALGFAILFVGRQFVDTDRGQVWRKPANYAARQVDFGYAVVGRLGQPSFPAVITDRLDGRGEIAFTDTRGQKRRYRGFEGYDLKVVTFLPLDSERKPFMLVLRRAV